MGDKDKLEKILNRYNIEGIMHFAAYAYVGESTEKSMMYYNNNVAESINFFNNLDSFYKQKRKKVPPIIFSSTCSVYGNTNAELISEESRTGPLNPYGRSKLIVESILEDMFKFEGVSSIRFRYFNAAGADIMLEAGEVHEPETHLIPLLIKAAEKREAKKFKIFGGNYPTYDGTCIRDYTHVSDLAEAHILGLEYLLNQENAYSRAINLGSGQGASNLEVLKTVEDITKSKIDYEIGPRRKGDAASLVADNHEAEAILKWKPKQSNLKTIIESAYAWHKKYRNCTGK